MEYNSTFFQTFNKVLLTTFLLSCLRFGNMIPLVGIDQLALKKSNIENSILGFINFYNILDAPLITSFSLGLSPYINSSILIDLFSTFVPSLQYLQIEEGQNGKKKLLFYKKLLALFFILLQASFLINSLLPYFYETNFYAILEIFWNLLIGSLITIWSANFIDKNGIGNGTSLIIFSTIIINLLQTIQKNSLNWDEKNSLGIFFLLFFCYFIYELQQKVYSIDVISARQLSILEEKKKPFLEKYLIRSENFFKTNKQQNGLLLKLTQAGIFPIIIATNIFPLLSNSFTISFQTNLGQFIYFCLIIVFNYFYTIVFWNPKKISEELQKFSVTILNIAPGVETITFLKKIVLIISILGGVYLCFAIFFYEIIKNSFDIDILKKINISSLIILIGISSDIQKKIKILTINLKYLNKK